MAKPRVDFIAYTDGGYTLQKSTGASACVIVTADRARELYRWSKVCQHSTNNRQEIGAIIHVVMNVPRRSRIKVYSDSQYAIGVLGGTMKAKANQDLVDIYRRTLSERSIDVIFSWVRGHDGDYYNEVVDGLCTAAVDRFLAGGPRVEKTENLCPYYYCGSEPLL